MYHLSPQREGLLDPPLPYLKMNIEERKKFIDWCKSKKLKKRTIYEYIGYYDKFGQAKNLTQKKVNNFLKRFNYNSVVKAFVKNYITFVILNKEDFSKEILDSTKEIIIPRETGVRPLKIPTIITEEEIWKIEKHFKREREKLMLLLSFYCGLRVGGLTSIKLDDFDWRSYWDSDCKDIGELKIGEKGSQERMVFVLPELMKRINNWISTLKDDLEENKPLFKIGSRRWRTLLNLCSEEALNKKISPHILRHSCATHLLKKGVPIEKVQRLLGHKSITSTQIYLHIVQEDLKQDYIEKVSFPL